MLPIHHPLYHSGEFWTAFGAIATMFTAIVALLVAFLERIFRHIDRPIIKAEFNSRSGRCVREALELPGHTARRYFRLKVENSGRTTLRSLKANVDIYKIDNGSFDNFEPSALRWITATKSEQNPAIDLAPNETNYINVFSTALEGSEKNLFRIELADTADRGIAPTRALEACILEVRFHGNNLMVPIVKKFLINPDPQDGDTILKELDE